ncbi:hypothetical protein BJQ94_07225 [Cryobacterium sp. SO2]|uniref:hypothetical protein n=1 Tax=Cryobacterium sp. SO2 TaxID=1897060 RepID=UPI00223E5B56|nr:hypothetical protein [Cryobacterium sp. SO2]WEO78814.1 hypothetical protein BJQ94_07225 [Cryobacterium sp. SO2]
MRLRRAGACALLAGALLLTGCAGSAPTDSFGCGIVVAPATAVVGEDVVVSRAPAAPAEICTTLVPGTSQTIELRSVFANDSARQTTTVTVADDGSFEATLPVPGDIRLGRARVTVIPPAESDCTAAALAAGTPDDCYFPGALFTVEFAPDTLTPLRIVSTDVPMPALPASDEPADSYALAGPGAHELTVVIFGSGCASRPATYRDTAAADSLEIVSEVIVPAGADGCTEQLMPWATVIEVPDGHRDYRSVTVDNLDTVPLNTVLLD